MTDSNPVSSKLKYGLLCLIAAVTFLCYSPTLQNQFTNWDDNVYLIDNPYIKNLTADNLKMLLLHNVTNNYYHPVTMLSLAVNYHFSKMEPFGYYLTNILLHVFNSCLVFLLMLMLLEIMEEKGYGAMNGKEWLAAIGALCFGLHPMHVESVSWLAERKDLLYALFYFLGLMVYVKYSKEEKVKWMVYVVICFILSLLSKPMAVSFPLSLLALDILLKRNKGIAKLCFEKLPFVLICIGAGVWAYIAANKAGSIALPQASGFLRKFIFASHNFMMYFLKAFVPERLCSYYPYPNTDALPMTYYISPFIDIAIIGLPLYISYKAGAKYFRITLFGLTFFFVNLMFILQLVAAGPTIMSERYTYMAYFGLFFIVVYFIGYLAQKSTDRKYLVFALAGCGLITLGVLCFNRTRVWQSTESLWQDVIKKFPDRVELAYNNLGSYYFGKGDIDIAFTYYKKAVDMHSGDAKVYSNVANIYAMRKDYAGAFSAYKQGLVIDSNDFVIYLNRGITYSILGKYDSAELDYNHAYKIDPISEKLLSARAYSYLDAGQYPKAIADYQKLIAINPNIALYYQKIAVAEANLGDTTKAFSDFNHSLSIKPNDGACLFDMSLTYKQLKNYSKALEFATKAQQAGYKFPDSYISNLQQSVNSSVK
jgi:tetratricopeptide (TPR) repeat protein